jgi:hypothetical protein
MYVRLFFPSRDRNGQTIESHTVGAVFAATRAALVDLAGGVTALAGTGSWRAADGAVMTENVTMFETYAPAGQATLVAVSDLAHAIARDLDQESVFYVVDGRPYTAAGSTSDAA